MDKNKKYILGLDLSTTTCGIALFEDLGDTGTLKVLEHISPKIKGKYPNMEKIFMKANLFYDAFMGKYSDYNVTKIIIEEPLLNSNNRNTVATLLRYNGILSHLFYVKYNVCPEYISSYDSRKFAFPELMGKKDHDSKGKKLTDAAFAKKEPTLFGAYPKDVDKKEVIWSKVNELEPNIEWFYDKKGKLAKESFDASDAACCVLGFMNKEGYWSHYTKNN